MNPLAFLRSTPVQRLLARAAAAAGTPLALHHYRDDEESPRTCAWGQCAACAYVAKRPGGRTECSRSRSGPAATALRQERPIPFICHMGFGCVSVPAMKDAGFVLTFGPFVAAEEAHVLENGILKGLAALADSVTSELPFKTDDIHRAPGKSVLAVAEWVGESLETLFQREREAQQAEDGASNDDLRPAPASLANRRRPDSLFDPYQAQAMALALADGAVTPVRNTLRALMDEVAAQKRPRPGQLRARILAAVFSAIEAAERAGLQTSPAWAAVADALADMSAAPDQGALLDAAMRILGPLARKAASGIPAARRTGDEALNALLSKHLKEGIELGEVARILGEKAPTISKRLKRNFGLSYSEYLGRLRIDKAKELLRRTRLSATEVAHRVGIRDQSHFSKLFRKFEGRTPSEYRELHGVKK